MPIASCIPPQAPSRRFTLHQKAHQPHHEVPRWPKCVWSFKYSTRHSSTLARRAKVIQEVQNSTLHIRSIHGDSTLPNLLVYKSFQTTSLGVRSYSGRKWGGERAGVYQVRHEKWWLSLSQREGQGQITHLGRLAVMGSGSYWGPWRRSTVA